jgi:hypothetical protein
MAARAESRKRLCRCGKPVGTFTVRGGDCSCTARSPGDGPASPRPVVFVEHGDGTDLRRTTHLSPRRDCGDEPSRPSPAPVKPSV